METGGKTEKKKEKKPAYGQKGIERVVFIGTARRCKADFVRPLTVSRRLNYTRDTYSRKATGTDCKSEEVEERVVDP